MNLFFRQQAKIRELQKENERLKADLEICIGLLDLEKLQSLSLSTPMGAPLCTSTQRHLHSARNQSNVLGVDTMPGHPQCASTQLPGSTLPMSEIQAPVVGASQSQISQSQTERHSGIKDKTKAVVIQRSSTVRKCQATVPEQHMDYDENYDEYNDDEAHKDNSSAPETSALTQGTVLRQNTSHKHTVSTDEVLASPLSQFSTHLPSLNSPRLNHDDRVESPCGSSTPSEAGSPVFGAAAINPVLKVNDLRHVPCLSLLDTDSSNESDEDRPVYSWFK